MELFNLFVADMLVIIAAQTTYTTYQATRGQARSRNSDIIVDTSVLMDGRIMPIAEAGFVPGDLVVPRSVIGELQLLADTGDSDKRERARRGLDVLKHLQELDSVTVRILQDGSRASEGVDERLLAHAKASGGSIATIDFNLNKVAAVENIKVLNINELARTLRMAYLPGDNLRLELTTTGTDSHQAVGHLADGTMVVVEHAKKQIGTTADVEIIRSLQTAAGRMMFARLAGTANAPSGKKPTPHRKTQPTPASSPTPPAKQKQHAGRKPVAPASEPIVKTDKTDKAQSAQAPKRSARRKSSSQREDSFIKLIDKQ